jgi:hypothetical protein
MRIPSSLALSVFVALSACASNSANTGSAEYNAGYSDGCATGSSAGGYPKSPTIRDEYAFRHNADYKAGWRTGYNACVVKTGRDPFGERERDRRF